MSVRLSYAELKGTWLKRWRSVESYIVNDVTYHRNYLEETYFSPYIRPNYQYSNEFDRPSDSDDSVYSAALYSIINDIDYFDVGGKLFKKRWQDGQLIFDRFYSEGNLDPEQQAPILSIFPNFLFHKYGQQYTRVQAMRGVSAFDVIDGDLTAGVSVSGLLPAYAVGEHEIYYSVTNSRGLTVNGMRVISVFVQQESIQTLPCGFLNFTINSSYFLNYSDGSILSREKEEELRSDETNLWLREENGFSLIAEHAYDLEKDGLPLIITGAATIIPFSLDTEEGSTLLVDNGNFAEYEILRYGGPNHSSGSIGGIYAPLTYYREGETNRKYSQQEILIQHVPEGYWNVNIKSYQNGSLVSERLLYSLYSYVPACDHTIEVSNSQCGDLEFNLGESVLKDSHPFADGSYVKYYIYEGSPFVYNTEGQQLDEEVFDNFVAVCLKRDNGQCLLTEPIVSEIEPEGYFKKPEELECLLTESNLKIDVAEDYIATDQCIEHKALIVEPIEVQEVDVEIELEDSISTEDCRFIYAAIPNYSQYIDNYQDLLEYYNNPNNVWAYDYLSGDTTPHPVQSRSKAEFGLSHWYAAGYNEGRDLAYDFVDALEIQGQAASIICEVEQEVNINADAIRESQQIGSLVSYPLLTESFVSLSISDEEDLEFQGSLEIFDLETESGFYINDDLRGIALERQSRQESIETELSQPLFAFEQLDVDQLMIESKNLLYRSGPIYTSNFFQTLNAGNYIYTVHVFNDSDQLIRTFSTQNEIEVFDCSCIQIEEGFCLTHGSQNLPVFLDFNIIDEIFQPDPCGLTIETDFGSYTSIEDIDTNLYLRTERDEVIYVAGLAECIAFQLEEEAEEALTFAYLNSLSAATPCELQNFELEGLLNQGLSDIEVSVNVFLETEIYEFSLTTEDCEPLLPKSNNRSIHLGELYVESPDLIYV